MRELADGARQGRARAADVPEGAGSAEQRGLLALKCSDEHQDAHRARQADGAAIDTSGELEGTRYTDPQSLGDKATLAWRSERFAQAGYRVPQLMQALAVDEAFYRIKPPSAAHPKARTTVTAATNFANTQAGRGTFPGES